MEAFWVTLALPMDEAEAVVRDALAAQGFGVLSVIDVAATLRAKLGVDRTPLKIFGACNPHLVEQALGIDPSVSLLLPCNIVLEAVEPGTRVGIADPRALMSEPGLAEIAGEAFERLSAVAAALART